MLRILRLASSFATAAALLAATSPASAEDWPRERHSPWGTYRVIYDFSDSGGPSVPIGTALIGADGLYYGVSAYGGGTSGSIYRMNADRTVTTLHVFDNATGNYPRNGMTLGSDGQFYGSAYDGGPNYAGVIYRLAADGSYTVMHAFDTTTPGSGRHPAGRLVEGPDGNFYGTTARGGQHQGHGTFFRMTPAGELTLLYSFRSFSAQHEPYSGSDFCLGPDGYFYAMGLNAAYRVALDGSTAEWRHFDAAKHGQAGHAGLILGQDGYLYGAMSEGGPRQGGTVFRLSPTTGELTILHAFPGPGDAGYARQAYRPLRPLMQAADGSLYGTVDQGGKWGAGGVYRVSPGGGFQQLVDFAGYWYDDTYRPVGALVQTPHGDLLGTGGDSGGLYGIGTIYALTPAH